LATENTEREKNKSRDRPTISTLATQRPAHHYVEKYCDDDDDDDDDNDDDYGCGCNVFNDVVYTL